MTTTVERANALKARSLKDLRGYRVMAGNEEVGKITDFYFDDVTWTIRYFVVETGSLLNKRSVLVSPIAFTDSDGAKATIKTVLTPEQIQEAPHADLEKPVSRQFETRLHQHFAWPMYWMDAPETLRVDGGDSHLRSVSEVLGYGIRAKDGEIGHVEDLITEERAWIIRYLAIDTRNWLPGRKVLVSPHWIAEVEWSDRTVTVDLTRSEIKDSPTFDPEQPVNRAYEERLYDYYGRPGYWV